MRRLVLLLSSMTLAVAIASCSSSSGTPTGGCTDYTPPGDFDAQNPKVSFKNDVIGVFKGSCAFSSCHGSTTANNGVYLGGNDSSKVLASIVNVKAQENPAMSFVVPGDPHASYLMRKMDGSQCVLNAQCTDGTCGDTMPKDSDQLPVERRDVIRRWIAQGAQDN